MEKNDQYIWVVGLTQLAGAQATEFERKLLCALSQKQVEMKQILTKKAVVQNKFESAVTLLQLEKTICLGLIVLNEPDFCNEFSTVHECLTYCQRAQNELAMYTLASRLFGHTPVKWLALTELSKEAA